ncbi:hypothetical protein Hanom_Chr08g00749141 [Helianthus anomalus]
MSWYNHIFGEPSDANTSTFIRDSSVAGSNVPDDWNGNDDHADEVVSGYRPHHNE